MRPRLLASDAHDTTSALATLAGANDARARRDILVAISAWGGDLLVLNVR